MIKQKILKTFVSGAILLITGASQAVAASTGFDSFTALPGSVAGGSLPESSPLPKLDSAFHRKSQQPAGARSSQ